MEAWTTMTAMDERSLAEQIEASKDDPDAWGEAEPPRAKRHGSDRRQRGAVVSVRLTADELARIQEYAEEAKLSLSGALRSAALAAADSAEARVTSYPATLRRMSCVAIGSSAAEGSTFTTATNSRTYFTLTSAR